MTSGDHQLSANAVMEAALRKIAYKLNQSHGQFKDKVPPLCAQDMVESYTIAREAIGALETARR
jgi:hypothetical protein